MRVLGREASMPPLRSLSVSLVRGSEAQSKVVRDVERLIVGFFADVV